jgi:hypothetical protein
MLETDVANLFATGCVDNFIFVPATARETAVDAPFKRVCLAFLAEALMRASDVGSRSLQEDLSGWFDGVCRLWRSVVSAIGRRKSCIDRNPYQEG